MRNLIIENRQKITIKLVCCLSIPGQASAFHMVGDVDVERPQVELPLEEAQHAAQHRAAVHADTHVQVHLNLIIQISMQLR